MDGRRWEVFPQGQAVSGGPPRWSGGVMRPIRMAGGLEALPKGLGGDGSHFW